MYGGAEARAAAAGRVHAARAGVHFATPCIAIALGPVRTFALAHALSLAFALAHGCC